MKPLMTYAGSHIARLQSASQTVYDTNELQMSGDTSVHTASRGEEGRKQSADQPGRLTDRDPANSDTTAASGHDAERIALQRRVDEEFSWHIAARDFVGEWRKALVGGEHAGETRFRALFDDVMFFYFSRRIASEVQSGDVAPDTVRSLIKKINQSRSPTDPVKIADALINRINTTHKTPQEVAEQFNIKPYARAAARNIPPHSGDIVVWAQAMEALLQLLLPLCSNERHAVGGAAEKFFSAVDEARKAPTPYKLALVAECFDAYSEFCARPTPLNFFTPEATESIKAREASKGISAGYFVPEMKLNPPPGALLTATDANRLRDEHEIRTALLNYHMEEDAAKKIHLYGMAQWRLKNPRTVQTPTVQEAPPGARKAKPTFSWPPGAAVDSGLLSRAEAGNGFAPLVPSGATLAALVPAGMRRSPLGALFALGGGMFVAARTVYQYSFLKAQTLNGEELRAEILAALKAPFPGHTDLSFFRALLEELNGENMEMRRWRRATSEEQNTDEPPAQLVQRLKTVFQGPVQHGNKTYEVLLRENGRITQQVSHDILAMETARILISHSEKELSDIALNQTEKNALKTSEPSAQKERVLNRQAVLRPGDIMSHRLRHAGKGHQLNADGRENKEITDEVINDSYIKDFIRNETVAILNTLQSNVKETDLQELVTGTLLFIHKETDGPYKFDFRAEWLNFKESNKGNERIRRFFSQGWFKQFLYEKYYLHYEKHQGKVLSQFSSGGGGGKYNAQFHSFDKAWTAKELTLTHSIDKWLEGERSAKTKNEILYALHKTNHSEIEVSKELILIEQYTEPSMISPSCFVKVDTDQIKHNGALLLDKLDIMALTHLQYVNLMRNQVPLWPASENEIVEFDVRNPGMEFLKERVIAVQVYQGLNRLTLNQPDFWLKKYDAVMNSSVSEHWKLRHARLFYQFLCLPDRESRKDFFLDVISKTSPRAQLESQLVKDAEINNKFYKLSKILHEDLITSEGYDGVLNDDEKNDGDILFLADIKTRKDLDYDDGKYYQQFDDYKAKNFAKIEAQTELLSVVLNANLTFSQLIYRPDFVKVYAFSYRNGDGGQVMIAPGRISVISLPDGEGLVISCAFLKTKINRLSRNDMRDFEVMEHAEKQLLYVNKRQYESRNSHLEYRLIESIFKNDNSSFFDDLVKEGFHIRHPYNLVDLTIEEVPVFNNRNILNNKDAILVLLENKNIQVSSYMREAFYEKTETEQILDRLLPFHEMGRNMRYNTEYQPKLEDFVINALQIITFITPMLKSLNISAFIKLSKSLVNKGFSRKYIFREILRETARQAPSMARSTLRGFIDLIDPSPLPSHLRVESIFSTSTGTRPGNTLHGKGILNGSTLKFIALKQHSLSTNIFINKLDKSYKKFSNKKKPIICYELAVYAGVTGKSLSKNVQHVLNRKEGNWVNYLERYKKLLGLPAGMEPNDFKIRSVQESGVINFFDKNGKIFHAGYIHQAPGEPGMFMHNNNMAVDFEIFQLDHKGPRVVGGLNVYIMDENVISGLEAFIAKNGEARFTSSVKINENVMLSETNMDAGPSKTKGGFDLYGIDKNARQRKAVMELNMMELTPEELAIRNKYEFETIGGAFELHTIQGNRAKILVVNAHGGYTTHSRPTRIPVNKDIMFLVPHGNRLVEPDTSLPFVDMIAGYMDRPSHVSWYSRLRNKNSIESGRSDFYSGYTKLHAGTDKHNNVMNYHISRYDNTPDVEVKLAVVKNRINNQKDVESPQKHYPDEMDVLTVKAEADRQKTVKDILELLMPGQPLSRYETVRFDICREQQTPVTFKRVDASSELDVNVEFTAIHPDRQIPVNKVKRSFSNEAEFSFDGYYIREIVEFKRKARGWSMNVTVKDLYPYNFASCLQTKI